MEGEEEHNSALTHSEILELLKFARVKYLRFLLDLVVLDEPSFELFSGRDPRDYRGRGTYDVQVGEKLYGRHTLQELFGVVVKTARQRWVAGCEYAL